MRQAVAVAYDLVDDIGLWRIERYRVVPNVLGGVEDAVGQGSVELKERYQPGRGHVLEAGERLQQLVHLDELRDLFFGKLESLFALQVGGAREALVEVVKLGADDAPDLLLGVGVRRDWWGSAGPPIHGQ